jgi:transcription factor IIIB 90 kDa subunit
VFELGHTYLQLVQTLNLRLPLVDPSHYISRFAALLEFGEETHRVASDAVRLVQRFDRDWLTRGRRPAGICGAALLLAARMNNFRRSIQEIVQVVKIADTTLKKRLEEFAETPTGALTVTDFRNVWLDEEMDPPAFTKGKEREEERNGSTIKKKTKGRKKRKRGEDDAELELEEWEKEALSKFDDGTIPEVQETFNRVDPSIFQDGILAGTITPGPDDKEPDDTLPLFFPDPDDANIDPSLRHPESAEGVSLDMNPADTAIDVAISEEVSKYLSNVQGTQLTSALDEVDQRRQAQRDVDEELLGLDEAELDAFIMTEEEVKIKERVWVELNRDYLESIAGKCSGSIFVIALFCSTVKQPRVHRVVTRRQKVARFASHLWQLKSIFPFSFSYDCIQRRKPNNKPRDASTPTGSTVAESVQNLLKKNTKYSKRINYNALKDLFVEDTAADDDKVEDSGLYSFDDDKDEGEEMVIEEEGGITTGKGSSNRAKPSSAPGTQDTVSLATSTYEEDVNANHEVDYGDDKGSDAGGWDDMYEQEAF